MTHEEQNGLVDQVCHKDQMVIWTSEIAGRLSDESYLKDRLAYSDVVRIHSILEDEVKSIVCTAFDLAALQAPQDAGECATDGCGNTATGRFESGGVGSHHCPSCLAKIAALSQPEAQAVPKGWKLVPIEPTEAMCVAGCREDDILGELVDWRGPDTTTREVVANLYRAILAASPATGGA